jgi:hypothetical protein
MSDRAPYSRVYWTVRSDPRLVDIYANDHHWATWNRLLLAADMAWPAPADLPATANRSSLRALVAAGVIEILPGGLFAFHGLDTERGRRRAAAASYTGPRRDPSGSETGPRRDPAGTQTPPSRRALDETRRDEPSIARPRARVVGDPKNGGAHRPPSTVDQDPLLAQIKAAQLERYGPDNTPTVPKPRRPLTSVEREREAKRLEALGEVVYERLLLDVGKEPDDLTRLDA